MSLISEDILEEYKRLRSPFRVARALGIDVRDVWDVIETTKPVIGPREAQERFGGFGRPELIRYMVDRKPAGGQWDNTLPEIKRAREAYEAGTIEMVTGRDGQWNILYAIPRKTRSPRPHYFRLGEFV